MRKNYFGTAELRWPTRLGQKEHTLAGCSKRPSSKAAASEEARRTLRYVESLSETRTPLADFFSILRDTADGNLSQLATRWNIKVIEMATLEEAYQSMTTAGR